MIEQIANEAVAQQNTILIAIFGGMSTIIQGLGLWIINDIKQRLVRLENLAMKKEQ